jgi:cohesin loading factor subunit SCC2
LAVRKRVIKLLKSFYGVTDDNSRRIDIATRLVLRMLDEDETVKDLAIKTIEELWFPPLPLASALKTKTRTTAPANNSHDKTALLSKVAVIMGTSANFKDRQSPLEDVLHKIMADKDGHEASSLDACYAEICEALIDGLVDASDLPGFVSMASPPEYSTLMLLPQTVINCIRTIYLLTSAYPSILSGTNASTLLPYLKNASTV